MKKIVGFGVLGGIMLLVLMVAYLQKSKDVTTAWDGFYLEQTSQTSETRYAIYSIDGRLLIKDSYMAPPTVSGSTKNQVNASFDLTETHLVPGDYATYRVLKNHDTYTIQVKGKGAFDYRLTKIAPRKYRGEDGIEYSTGYYLE